MILSKWLASVGLCSRVAQQGSLAWFDRLTTSGFSRQVHAGELPSASLAPGQALGGLKEPLV